MDRVLNFLQQLSAPPAVVSAVRALTGVNEIFLLLTLLAVILYGLSVGRTRAAISLLAIYAAFALTVLFPFFDDLRAVLNINLADYMLRVVTFLVIYGIVFAILNESTIKTRLSTGDMALGSVLVISLFQVGFLCALILSLIPRDSIPSFARSLYPYLGSARAVFLWASAALLVLVFMRPRR